MRHKTGLRYARASVRLAHGRTGRVCRLESLIGLILRRTVGVVPAGEGFDSLWTLTLEESLVEQPMQHGWAGHCAERRTLGLEHLGRARKVPQFGG